jgi:hypothetical protein
VLRARETSIVVASVPILTTVVIAAANHVIAPGRDGWRR